MADEKDGGLDYLKAALGWQYNKIALGGVAAFAVVSGSILPLVPRPGGPLGMVVETGHAVPGVAAVFGAEQAVRRRAGVPHALLGGVSGREPEDVCHHASALSFGSFGEGGRSASF